jgi:hypothetical protein
VFAPATVVSAGVTNPDISVIGQPFVTWTDDANSFARKRVSFDAGETELVLDAALNPYARGTFTISYSAGEAAVEEAFFLLQRGLPGDIAVKGGKYRVGFGKLNATHPHQYPFAERFGVLAAYLPGDEAYNETGIDASWRVPLPGTISVTLSGDVLQGDSFRVPRTPTLEPNDPLVTTPENSDRTLEPRAAWVGRLAAFVPAGDRSGVEIGLSGTEGTSNVAASARTRVLGADAKAKWWTSANAYLLLQGEWLHIDRDEAGWNGPAARYTLATTRASGGYLFADFNWRQRYNAGASFESFEDPEADGSQSAFGLFTGLALMEETTAFRLDWRRTQPARAIGASADPDPIQQLTLRAIFSMGPHKAHQF